MPARSDIKSILVIGSGPIVIGQACEFDYSGTQACHRVRVDICTRGRIPERHSAKVCDLKRQILRFSHDAFGPITVILRLHAIAIRLPILCQQD